MTIEELSARLEAVERANRRFRAGGIAALVLVAAGVAMGQAGPPGRTVQAEKFVVLGKDGNPRIGIGVLSNGDSGMTLFDNDGNVRAVLSTSPEGSPKLIFSNRGGEPCVGLLTSGLSISEGDGAAGVGLGSGELSFSDSNGKIRALLAISPDGSPALALSDKEGRTRASLHALYGSPGLDIFDKSGKRRAALGVTGLDAGKMGGGGTTPPSSLAMFDQDGKLRALLGVGDAETLSTKPAEKTAPSSLVLRDDAGKVTFQAPPK